MEYKILITGTMGAGKTTAIQQVSDSPAVLTDVHNTRQDESAKPTTTAAFDFGELALGEGDCLRIYGTPGQERFSFMWPILARGAIGIIYLVDATRESPIDDLDSFIKAFGESSGAIPSVVGLNKCSDENSYLAPAIQDYLDSKGLQWPVLLTDVRERSEVLELFEILISLNEALVMEQA
ncbi:GTP-binding protein [Marinobacter lipolyticus]|uniref:GTP-binding protein n=1 Tax=Marinobacter lipolyticus TaxID=209639 RepID=UPI003A91CF14